MEKIDKDRMDEHEMHHHRYGKYHRHNSRRQTEKRLLMGGLLMIFGGLLLLFNFDLIPYHFKKFIFTWQMIPIVIGIISLVSSHEKTTGIILIAVGLFFYLPEFYWFDEWHLKRLFWPAMFILIGFLIIFRRPFDWGKKKIENEIGADHDHIDDMAVFGGGDRVVTSKNFKGGKVTSIFGGSTFDLNNAELSQGSNVIDVFALFGGNKFLVPSDWKVKVEVTGIFGGFSDKRKTMPSLNVETDKELLIRGVVIFGGGEIKNF
ncbi:LiaI-LiaF-like domain-containing protein [Bacteroidota bacterium]